MLESEELRYVPGVSDDASLLPRLERCCISQLIFHGAAGSGLSRAKAKSTVQPT